MITTDPPLPEAPANAGQCGANRVPLRDQMTSMPSTSRSLQLTGILKCLQSRAIEWLPQPHPARYVVYMVKGWICPTAPPNREIREAFRNRSTATGDNFDATP
jgi:hypothetical protein